MSFHNHRAHQSETRTKYENVPSSPVIAISLPRAMESSGKILTGINQFIEMTDIGETVEIPYRYSSSESPDFSNDAITHLITWADQTVGWLPSLFERGIKIVNCCRDWSGVIDCPSVAPDMDSFCGLVLDHFSLRSPELICAIGVNFQLRPQAAETCQRLIELGMQRGWQGNLFELKGIHPDSDIQRIQNVAQETELLECLESLKLPAAIWCENDHIARMVCNAAAILNWKLPGHAYVMGAGDYRIATATNPTITSIPKPLERIGYVAAQLISQWIEFPSKPPADVFVEPDPVVSRESTDWSQHEVDLIQRALEIVRHDACAGLTVESLAGALGVSRVTLTSQFLDKVGVTPGKKIRSRKIEVACELLSQTTKLISEITLEVGFSEQSKFSKFFRRETGFTPSEYRATNK